MICEAKGDRDLHLFDTFEGLPQSDDKDDKQLFRKGQYEANYEEVKQYLAGYANVHIYKGYFPNTAAPINDKFFSFVSLDVDLYESTKKALDFFYSRMSKGGIILSHDYQGAKGVKKAFQEFMKDKPEPIVEIAGNQCLIIKI